MLQFSFFLINLVLLVVIGFVVAFRQAAKGRPGWPGVRMLTLLAGISAFLLVVIAVAVYNRPRELPQGEMAVQRQEALDGLLKDGEQILQQGKEQIDKLRTWKPDPDSLEVLDEYTRLIDVPITEAETPEQYTLQLAPEPDRKCRFITVTTVRHETNGLDEQQSSEYLVDERSEVITRTDEGELLIKTDGKKLWSLSPGADKAREMPVSAIHYLFVVRNGDVHLAQQEGSRLNVQKSPVVGALRDSVTFDLPKDGTPQVGASWSSSTKTPASESTVEHTLVGFAEVDGTLTAKFVSESDTTFHHMPHSPELEKARKEVREKAAKMRERLRSVGWAEEDLPPVPDVSVPSSIHAKVVTYVDVATGIVLRAETEATPVGGNPMQPKTTTVSVAQRLPVE
jgi:hypothetical protein